MLLIHLILASLSLVASESLFPYTTIQATPYLTHENSEFGAYIEGTSVDRYGNVYAVNYGTNLTQHQFGQLYPSQKLVYTDTDKNALLSSSKFHKANLYLTESVNHKVLRMKVKGEGSIDSLEQFCGDSSMLQPNDLTISKSGTVYLSGMSWLVNSTYQDGDLWSCTSPAKNSNSNDAEVIATKLDTLARTNGIELSYDQKFLYLSESVNINDAPAVQKIYRYQVNPKDGSVYNRQLFKEFKDSGDQDIDGMKTDVKGNLYVTRYGGSKVIVLNPQGEQVLEIKLNILTPANLEFGGKGGKTLFVVGQCNQYEDYGWGKGCVDTVDLPYPGAQWTRLNKC